MLAPPSKGGGAHSSERFHPQREPVITLSSDSASCSRMGSHAMSEECPERRFRTLFISDVHLGARGSQAERLLDFLRSHDADTIYLVGDIVAASPLQSTWYSPQPHHYFVPNML